MPAVVPAVAVSEDPQSYERDHVHAVYDEIAPHFSSTRYKPWPIIAHFLSSLPTGWVGLDSGTGNGKYLPLPLERPGSVWTIGLDRSRNLLEIARKAGDSGVVREVVWGDVLGKPWRNGAFDYAISIATIHHLSTPARRKEAVQRILQCISPSHGRALIYVWAIEQDELSKRNIPVASEGSQTPQPLESESKGQDVFVPWVLSPQPASQPKPKRRHKAAPPPEDISAPAKTAVVPESASETRVFNRYYHMFAQGELLQLVCDAASDMGLAVNQSNHSEDAGAEGKTRGIDIMQNGWERSNYYIELRCWEGKHSLQQYV